MSVEEDVNMSIMAEESGRNTWEKQNADLLFET